MKNDLKTKKRKNGIYYTPENLARFLAKPLIRNKNISVLDPAYGNGALLLAAESLYSMQNDKDGQIRLFGCDIHPVNGLLKHLPEANLREEDFFDYSPESKYDIILTNPPYIRHQNQESELIKKYRSNHKELRFLSKSSDLWAYFLVKSIQHLKSGGDIGAIVPWAFIQADYAQPLRKFLLNHFEKIKVLSLNCPYFKPAEERVSVVWLKNFGTRNRLLEFAFSKDLESFTNYSEIRKEDWLSNKIIFGRKNVVEKIFNKLQLNFGFTRFSEHADSRIGIVTGANKYFIREFRELKELGFIETQLIPILTSTNDLPDYLLGKSAKLKRLFYLNDTEEDEFQDLIQEGKDLGYHLRAHSQLRTPWYSVNLGKIPDAFFPYRIGEIPYLVPNKSRIQSTNSIHRIYFKGLSISEKKWILVSMLSIYGQLSLEANAKTYGRGMLKIEPGSLGKVFVLKKGDQTITKTYNRVIQLLGNNQKFEAVKVSTAFLNNEINIPVEFQKATEQALRDIRGSRK